MSSSIVVAILISIFFLRRYLSKQLTKSKKIVINPEDMNKEPSDLLKKMNKVYLLLEVLDHPERGMRQDLDHRKELLEDVDDYWANMRPFTTVVSNDLLMPKDKFAHIGYYFQGDLFDLDGKHLYESKRWVNDLNKNFPWIKKGPLHAITNAISSMFKRN